MRWQSISLSALLLCIAPALSNAGEPGRGDYYGDPLPPGAVARLGTVRLRHLNVYGLEFSRDGKRLISLSAGDGTIRIWDVASGKLIERKPAPEGKPRPEKLLPGGAMVAAADKGGM